LRAHQQACIEKAPATPVPFVFLRPVSKSFCLILEEIIAKTLIQQAQAAIIFIASANPPQTIFQGTALLFTPTATGGQGRSATFSGLPMGAGAWAF
jgi:hypothetical protein